MFYQDGLDKIMGWKISRWLPGKRTLLVFLRLKPAPAGITLINGHLMMRLDKSRIRAPAFGALDWRLPIRHDYLFLLV